MTPEEIIAESAVAFQQTSEEPLLKFQRGISIIQKKLNMKQNQLKERSY